jgi:repressor LexA
MNSATAVEQRILDAIKNHINLNGFSPTYRDLMIATGYTSPAPVQGAVYRLRDKGLVTFLDNQARTLRLVD